MPDSDKLFLMVEKKFSWNIPVSLDDEVEADDELPVIDFYQEAGKEEFFEEKIEFITEINI